MTSRADLDSAIAGYVRRGLSVRAISDELARVGLKASKSSVARHVERQRAERGAAPPPRDTKPTKPDPKTSAADVAAAVVGLDALDMTSLRALDARLETALTEEVEPKTLVQLTDCKVRLAQAMARLVPPMVPDPQSDPANVEAAALLVKLLDGMVADAERRARAAH